MYGLWAKEISIDLRTDGSGILLHESANREFTKEQYERAEELVKEQFDPIGCSEEELPCALANCLAIIIVCADMKKMREEKKDDN